MTLFSDTRSLVEMKSILAFCYHCQYDFIKTFCPDQIREQNERKKISKVKEVQSSVFGSVRNAKTGSFLKFCTKFKTFPRIFNRFIPPKLFLAKITANLDGLKQGSNIFCSKYSHGNNE